MSFLQSLFPDSTFIRQKVQFSLHCVIFQIKFIYLELSSPWKLTLQILEALQTFPRILFTSISGLCKPSFKTRPFSNCVPCPCVTCRIILNPSVAWCIHSVRKVKASVSGFQLSLIIRPIITSLHSKVHVMKRSYLQC